MHKLKTRVNRILNIHLHAYFVLKVDLVIITKTSCTLRNRYALNLLSSCYHLKQSEIQLVFECLTMKKLFKITR